MCYDRGLIDKMNNIFERAVKIVEQDKKNSIQTLLKRDKSMSLHIKSLKYLVIESFEIKNLLSPEIMK